MVKKLLKHEATYYSRTLIIYEIVLFSLAFFARILMFFESDTVPYVLLQGMSFILFGLSVFGCIMMAVVTSVVRFYKNLFTTEGYLTFSLPVSTHQHIFAKLIAALVYNIVVFISTILAFMVSISGDLLTEVFKAISYLFGKILPEVASTEFIVNLIIYIVEFIIISIVSVACNLLLYYCCIAIGQTAKKNRILAAVGTYFGYVAATQILSTIFSISLTVSINETTMEKIGKFIQNHTYGAVHIMILSSLLVSVLLGLLFYIITHRIITRKLNLE